MLKTRYIYSFFTMSLEQKLTSAKKPITHTESIPRSILKLVEEKGEGEEKTDKNKEIRAQKPAIENEKQNLAFHEIIKTVRQALEDGEDSIQLLISKEEFKKNPTLQFTLDRLKRQFQQEIKFLFTKDSNHFVINSLNTKKIEPQLSAREKLIRDTAHNIINDELEYIHIAEDDIQKTFTHRLDKEHPLTTSKNLRLKIKKHANNLRLSTQNSERIKNLEKKIPNTSDLKQQIVETVILGSNTPGCDYSSKVTHLLHEKFTVPTKGNLYKLPIETRIIALSLGMSNNLDPNKIQDNVRREIRTNSSMVA